MVPRRVAHTGVTDGADPVLDADPFDLVILSTARDGILIDMRIDFDPQAMDAAAFYKLLTAVVVPRPIAWVSTVAPGSLLPNLAPTMF